MDYQLTSYAIAQFSTAVISIIVAVIMWKRRIARSGWQLFLLFVAISEWTLANGLEAAAIPQDQKIFWSKVAYIGAQTAPVLLMLFALAYTGRIQRLKPGIIALLFVIPGLIIFAAATNDSHNLVWISFNPGPPGTNSLLYHHGPIFWLGVAYIFTMVSFATTFLVVFAVRSQKVYRFQHFIILLACIMPWLGTIVYLFDLSPFPGLDTTSIGFLFTGILLMIGLSKGKMLNYIPVAHELIFANIEDGIIVFDENLRIMDMNPAAQLHLFVKFSDVVGQSLDKISTLPGTIFGKFEKDKNYRFEMVSPLNHKTWFNVSVTPLRDNRKGFFGWVMFFEDISKRKETEEKLKLVNQRLEHQIKEIRELENQLREAANQDSMTGVYNRRYLEDTLKREIARAKRKNYPLSLIMLDVDKFKDINDTYGHKIGDEVVTALANMLKNSTREADCVSRYGGDEFVLVMPEMSKEHAYQRAEKWRKECKELEIKKSKKAIQFSISIGIATCPMDGETNEALLDSVDQALYYAKQAGRDCTRLAD